jgi:hypothetical protein
MERRMNLKASGRRGRAWQALDWVFIRMLCIDPRLMAAYQVTLAEIAADGCIQRTAQHEGEVSIADTGQAAAGALA